MTTDTTWYPIPGYSQYEMTDAGDVRTIDGQIQEIQNGGGGHYYNLQSNFGTSTLIVYKHQMIKDLRERLALAKED